MKWRNALLKLSREHHQALVLTLRIAKATEAKSNSAPMKSVPKTLEFEFAPVVG